jgi:hypothetical protein
MPSNDSPKLENVNQAAERLGVSVSYMNKMRLVGGGPRFIKMGARVLYDPADLAAWLDAQKRSSTSEITDRVSA